MGSRRLEAGPDAQSRRQQSAGDEEGAAITIDEEQRTASRLADGTLKLRDVCYGLMIHFLNHVALLQAGVGHFAGRVDVGDNDAFGGWRDAELASDGASERFDVDAFESLAAGIVGAGRVVLCGVWRHL